MRAALPRRQADPIVPLQKSLSELNHIQVQRELDIHGRLHHANVLELYAVFEDADAYYFVMQCVHALRVNRKSTTASRAADRASCA